jgi:hypothetical protein
MKEEAWAILIKYPYIELVPLPTDEGKAKMCICHEDIFGE